MKVLRQAIFTFFVFAALTLTVSAQRDDRKPERPPKNPPTIDPGRGKPPRDPRPPKSDDKPKKPEESFVIVAKRFDGEFA
jgi:hypothetical protein